MSEEVPGSGDGRERALELLGHADSSIQRAQLGTVSPGPLQHTIDGMMYLLKYVETLGIQLNELSDAFTRSERERSAGDAGREFAELGELIEQASAMLALSPEELAARLARIKSGASVDTQGVEPQTRHIVPIMLTWSNFQRLITAASMAGVDSLEFATAAVLRAVDTVVGPAQ
jgi:hypothetical protein